MSQHPREPGEATAGRIDEICDRFEAAWKARQRPALEDYLAEGEGLPRPALLRELLRLELDYRRRAGERPTRAEYRARFPDDGPTIDGAFGAAPGAPVLPW